MSTLTVTNIKATGETASRAVSGVAAAWVNFDLLSATAAILSSSNTSSLTDNGTGDASFGLSNAMSDADYAGVCGPFDSNSNSSIVSVSIYSSQNTSSSVRVLINTSSAGAFDAPFNSVSLMGDLA